MYSKKFYDLTGKRFDFGEFFFQLRMHHNGFLEATGHYLTRKLEDLEPSEWKEYIDNYFSDIPEEILNTLSAQQKSQINDTKKRFIATWMPKEIEKQDTTTLHSQKETKADQLIKHLNDYGFESIPKINALSEAGKAKLIEKITEEKAPYQIAMLDFLGFISHLERNYTEFHTKEKTNIELANWLNVTVRTIKGNRNVLNPKTTDNKARYTAYKHTENIKNTYEQLK